MDRRSPAAGAGLRLGQCIPCPPVLGPRCRRGEHRVEGAVSQVWLLGLSQQQQQLCSLCPDISPCSAAPSTSLAPGHGCPSPACSRACSQGGPKAGGVLGGLLEETSSDNRAVALGWVWG